jgi:ATP-dependent DNA helicase RecG
MILDLLLPFVYLIINQIMNENQHIEYKPNFNEDVIETLVAFANAKGGKVLVGVDDKGKPVKNFTIGK